MRNLQGRVAVITGAGSGIGRALSIEFARRGCDIALVDIQEAGIQETAKAVHTLHRKTSLHIADVTNAKRMSELPDEVLQAHGRVNILVNNAGVSHAKDLVETPPEDIDWVVGINLRGVLYGCHYFLPHLLKQDEAHIVLMSSMLGFVGLPSQTLYSATKFAIRGLGEALWGELAMTNVGVTCVHPGAVRTNILKAARVDTAEKHQRLIDMMDKHSMAPDVAARKIVNAVAKNQHKKVICLESHIFHWASRIFPGPFRWILAHVYLRTDYAGKK